MTLKKTRHTEVYKAIIELINEHPEYPVSRLCILGGINKSSFYKWKNHLNTANDELNEHIAEEVVTIHNKHPDMGYRRIRDTLEHDYAINVNDKRILRICRKKKIQSYIKHHCRPSISSLRSPEYNPIITNR